MYDLLVKSGRAVLPTGIARVDLGIREGRIAAIGDLGHVEAQRIVDARDGLVLPGLVDPHVHLNDHDSDTGLRAQDDFFTGTVAAAFGGTTTVIHYAFSEGSQRSDSVSATAIACRAGADGQVGIDYGLHVIADSDSARSLASVGELPALGINSVKLMMMHPPFTDDYSLVRMMSAAAQDGLLVLVHAENATLLQGHQRMLAEDGRLSVAEFPHSRPVLAEVEAVQRAILLAETTGATLYVVHISCGQAVEQVREARRRGLKVIGETVPHYLTLTEGIYRGPCGANMVCSPPIRSERDREELWAGLVDGTIDVIGSDHCGYTAAQKMSGQTDFRLIPQGIAGIETRGVVMFSEGVVAGRISLQRYVDLLSTNPARVFGLYPRKGVLAPGSDADLWILDPSREWSIAPEALHVGWGYSPNDGLRVTGLPVMTVLRGRVIIEEGAFMGERGGGQYLFRGPPQMPYFREYGNGSASGTAGVSRGPVEPGAYRKEADERPGCAS